MFAVTENSFSFLRIAFLMLHFYSLAHFYFLARDSSASTDGSSGLYKRIQYCLPKAILKEERREIVFPECLLHAPCKPYPLRCHDFRITDRGMGLGEGQCHADGGCKGDGEFGNQSWVWIFLKFVLSLPPSLPSL